MANRLHLESGGCFADEAYTGGVLDGLRIANRFDQFQRRTNLALINSQVTVLAATDYGYDTASRFQSVSQSGNTATYSYLANSPLIEQVVFKQDATTPMTTESRWQAVRRLDQRLQKGDKLRMRVTKLENRMSNNACDPMEFPAASATSSPLKPAIGDHPVP
jgi:hypothetical protein